MGLTIEQCKEEAARAANLHAAANSDRLTGHGRKPHGRDAKGKAKNHDRDKSRMKAWEATYNQTLDRLLRENGHR